MARIQIDWQGNTVPQGWNNVADIPNEVGFTVTVLRLDGSQAQTSVQRDSATGCHSLIGVRVRDLSGWKPQAQS